MYLFFIYNTYIWVEDECTILFLQLKLVIFYRLFRSPGGDRGDEAEPDYRGDARVLHQAVQLQGREHYSIIMVCSSSPNDRQEVWGHKYTEPDLVAEFWKLDNGWRNEEFGDGYNNKVISTIRFCIWAGSWDDASLKSVSIYAARWQYFTATN